MQQRFYGYCATVSLASLVQSLSLLCVCPTTCSLFLQRDHIADCSGSVSQTSVLLSCWLLWDCVPECCLAVALSAALRSYWIEVSRSLAKAMTAKSLLIWFLRDSCFVCFLAASVYVPQQSCVILRDCDSQRFVKVAVTAIGTLPWLLRLCRSEGFVSFAMNATMLPIWRLWGCPSRGFLAVTLRAVKLSASRL